MVGDAIATELVLAFLSAQMGSEFRFQRRLGKLNAIEAANFASE